MKKKCFSSILVFASILIFFLSLVGTAMAQLKPQQRKPQTYQQPTIQRQPTVTTPLNQPAQIWQTLVINAFQIRPLVDCNPDVSLYIQPRVTCNRNVSLYIAGRGYEYRVSEYEDFRGASWKPFRSGTVPFTLRRASKIVCYASTGNSYDNDDYCGEPRIVYAQLRDKQGNNTAPKQAEVRLAPELKVYSVPGAEAWNLAKNKGAKCRLIKCYPASYCNSNTIPGLAFTQDRTNPFSGSGRFNYNDEHPIFVTEGVSPVNGGKFDFDAFYSFNLNPGWTFVEYDHRYGETHYTFIPSHGHVYKKILSQPQPGGRRIYLKVRLWVHPALYSGSEEGQTDVRIGSRRGWFWIHRIVIKGPNCRDPLDAFR